MSADLKGKFGPRFKSAWCFDFTITAKHDAIMTRLAQEEGISKAAVCRRALEVYESHRDVAYETEAYWSKNVAKDPIGLARIEDALSELDRIQESDCDT